MIYFITGINARNIRLEELYKEFDNIRIYDANNKEELNNFYTDISNVSIFQTNDLVVLKRCEKLKKLDEVINYIASYIDNSKSIAIDYYYEYKGKNPYLSTFKKMNAEIINIEDANSLVMDYIKKELNIKAVEAKKIIDIIGTDYNHVKNEVFKYKSVIDNEYSFDKIKDIILKNQDKKINEYLSEIYENKIDIDLIPKDFYIPLIYAIYKDFEIFHKLNILKLSKNYNEFMNEYKEYESVFKINYYVVFLKYKNMKFDKNKSLTILKKCNEMESKLKIGTFSDKMALFNIIKEIQK